MHWKGRVLTTGSLGKSLHGVSLILHDRSVGIFHSLFKPISAFPRLSGWNQTPLHSTPATGLSSCPLNGLGTFRPPRFRTGCVLCPEVLGFRRLLLVGFSAPERVSPQPCCWRFSSQVLPHGIFLQWVFTYLSLCFLIHCGLCSQTWFWIRAITIIATNTFIELTVWKALF